MIIIVTGAIKGASLTKKVPLNFSTEGVRLSEAFLSKVFLSVPSRGFDIRFRLGTGLMSDALRGPAVVDGEKLAELNDDGSLVFTKARWFTGTASVFSEAGGKSCGLKVFLSQG
jgi:hypothetical protein